MEDIYKNKDYIELREKLKEIDFELSKKLIMLMGQAVQYGIHCLSEQYKKSLSMVGEKE